MLLKKKITLLPHIDWEQLLDSVKEQYKAYPMCTEDGIKILFKKAWIHLRKSNTEPIVRLHVEAAQEVQAVYIVKRLMQHISTYCQEQRHNN